MKTKTIKQNIVLKASPDEIFEMLMDSGKHSDFTASRARISKIEGGKFSAYDGYCSGKNLKINKPGRIEQLWRANDWEEGHFSHVTFIINGSDGKTKLSFTQSGVPASQYKAIKDGWHEYYWTPMKNYIEEKA